MGTREHSPYSLNGKRILVTGACGTVGLELVRQLLAEYRPGELMAADNNESGIFFLEQEFQEFTNFKSFLGDVRDRDKLSRRSRGVDVIFHCAAFKHVTLCERSPFEAVQTNILGVQNIIYAANENKVKRVLFTSSDKAVNPTNVMGTSKLMGERLITAANNYRHEDGPIFSSTRFGNILGSRGSVLPIFKRQIKDGGPVTLTDDRMTRFIMTAEEAARLVLDTVAIAKGGEVFITKMPVIRIVDLAKVMVQELASAYGHDPKVIQIDKIGSKPGEKLYEELMSGEEIRRALELERYFVVLPAFRNLYREIEYAYLNLVSDTVSKPYISNEEPFLNRKELTNYLHTNGLLNTDT